MIYYFEDIAVLVIFYRHTQEHMVNPLNRKFAIDRIGISQVTKTDQCRQYQAYLEVKHITSFHVIEIAAIHSDQGEERLLYKRCCYQVLEGCDHDGI